MPVRIDDEFLARRTAQRRAVYQGLGDAPDGAGFGDAINLPGDRRIAKFADGIIVGAIRLVFNQILQCHGRGFEGLQQGACRCGRL
ncbi:hypothetical protein D3C80_1399730 [compost metagenome]